MPAESRISQAGVVNFAGVVVALSPDGTNLVYVANNRLYLRSMDSLEARAIGGTESMTSSGSPTAQT